MRFRDTGDIKRCIKHREDMFLRRLFGMFAKMAILILGGAQCEKIWYNFCACGNSDAIADARLGSSSGVISYRNAPAF
jgi:hypothetical protein